MALNILPGRRAHLRVLLTAVALVTLLAPARLSADLFRVGGSLNTLMLGGVWRGVDVAYDPNNGVFLVVTSYGATVGAFTNSAGQTIATFPIHTTSFSHFPRVRYSPDVNNGAGGFLVVWLDSEFGNSVKGRTVSYTAPGYLVSPVTVINDPAQGASFFEYRPSIAYSTTSDRFLVVWSTQSPAFGVQGRFVSPAGSPQGGVLRFEEGNSRDPGATWNPGTDEFGVVNTGWGGSGAHTQFRRVRASDGAVLGKTTFGFSPGTYATGIDMNSANQYVVTWALHPGTTSAVFDASGNLLGTNFVSGRFGGDNSMGYAHNHTTNSGLVVGSDHNGGTYEVVGVQLNPFGVPASSATVLTEGGLPSYYPLVASRTGTAEWNVVRSLNYQGASNQLVSGNAVSTPPPTSPPPPPPTSTGCTTPDPFASIGGGNCVNGGWTPKGTTTPPPTTPTPPPPPPPTSTGCSTPDPFVSIGGGTCVNGGWIPGQVAPPPSAPPPTAPPPTSTGCTTPDPFASIGGGTCVNGGWTPGRNAAGGCTTPDPFASLGGGTCVNGGWTPGISSGTSTGCSTPDPFVSIGGGSCVNGGWVPRSSSCAGADPFASIGGGVCINGGWVPKG